MANGDKRREGNEEEEVSGSVKGLRGTDIGMTLKEVQQLCVETLE